MQIRPGGKLLLRNPRGLAQIPYPSPDGRRQVARHSDMVTMLTTIGLHTIVFIVMADTS